MQHVESQHGPGTVIVPAASLARYNEFWLSVESLRVPTGTRLVAARGADIPHQLNEGIRRMTGSWAWILGDDHIFSPDLLLNLLDRHLDVVMPIVPRRDDPFYPCLLHGPIAPTMTPYAWSDLPLAGLFQLPRWDSAGQAGCLVKKTVLDQLGDPWFEGGQLTPGRLMEDMYFFHRLHELNVPIYIDCDAGILDHIANLRMTAHRHQGRWYVGFIGKRGTPCLLDMPEVYVYNPTKGEMEPPHAPSA
jgi:hypothetical protein